jgi:hypothetical protein
MKKAVWVFAFMALQSEMTRWTIEETIRFIKPSYRLEDIRLPTYQQFD